MNMWHLLQVEKPERSVKTTLKKENISIILPTPPFSLTHRLTQSLNNLKKMTASFNKVECNVNAGLAPMKNLLVSGYKLCLRCLVGSITTLGNISYPCSSRLTWVSQENIKREDKSSLEQMRCPGRRC